MKRTRFAVDVTDTDEIDVWLDVDAGRTVAFSANYRALVREVWCEVMRYDTAHGILHVHRFWKGGPDRVKVLADAPISDYTKALSAAMDDLETNWPRYRANLEAQA